uniref:SiaC family regulatory phosphoprotein domain-containing protein n=1 Tax=mine drainage metagenome TaxID=410659 RepID=E6QRA6_9ZZZZ
MNNFYIKATEDSPEVNFDFDNHILHIAGEAYPENAVKFFYPIITNLNNYLQATSEREIAVNFHLIYFNSASTKMLHSIFGLLNKNAQSNMNHIVVNWHHDEEDDTVLEFCMELKEDFHWLEFITIGTVSAH